MTRPLLKRFAIFTFLFVCVTFFMLVTVSIAAMRIWPEPDKDALIVLGCGISGLEVGPTLRKRLDRALEYYLANPQTLIVVSGGQGPGESICEAGAMRYYLLRMGVPDSSIVMESRSTNTRENLLFSREILDEIFEEDYRVAVVTSDFHILRAMNYASLLGLRASPLASPSALYLWPRFFAREYLALMWYYVFYSWR